MLISVRVRMLLAAILAISFVCCTAKLGAEPLENDSAAAEKIDKEQEDKPDEPETVPETATPVQARYPGLLVRSIKIAQTDPDLASDPREHWTYYQPNVKHRGQLLVSLPGTHGRASSNSNFEALAAQLGYHVLDVTYRSGIALAALRRSPDPNGFLKGRENLIYGSDPFGPFQADRANSIVNRLVKALKYLDKTYPKEGWGAYLQGDEPAWQKLVVSGISQGGGHACLLGIQHPVERVLMFGAPKDFSLYFNSPAQWLSMPSETTKTRFFCFVHSGDEHHGCTYKQQVQNYRALGLYPQFPIIDVENSAPPYNHTRLLTAHTPADIPKHNHGMVAGATMFMPAWKYLLTEPCE